MRMPVKIVGTAEGSWISDLMDKQQGNLQDAQRQVDDARRDLAHAIEETERLRNRGNTLADELSHLGNPEEALAILLNKKAEQLELDRGPIGAKWNLVNEELCHLRRLEKEITETARRGSRARVLVRSILENLSHAQEWANSTIRGGIVAISARDTNINDAKRTVQQTRKALTEFDAELGTIHSYVNQINRMDSTLVFSDFPNDRLKYDWVSWPGIVAARPAVGQTLHQIERIVFHITQQLGAVKDRLRQLERRRDHLLNGLGQAA